MASESASEGHLPAEEMAQLASGAAAGAMRDRLYSHVAGCAECRAEVIEVHRILRTHVRAGRRRQLVVAGIGAAAILAVAVLIRTPRATTSEALTRSAPPAPGGTPALIAIEPLGIVAPTPGPLKFVWTPVPGAVEYRLTLTDQDGKTLWTRSSRDTTLLPPLEVSMPTGFSYYWFVDALLPDGESVTTGTREFRIRR